MKAAVTSWRRLHYIHYNHLLTQKYSEFWLVRYNGLVWSNIAVTFFYHPIYMIIASLIWISRKLTVSLFVHWTLWQIHLHCQCRWLWHRFLQSGTPRTRWRTRTMFQCSDSHQNQRFLTLKYYRNASQAMEIIFLFNLLWLWRQADFKDYLWEEDKIRS